MFLIGVGIVFLSIGYLLLFLLWYVFLPPHLFFQIQPYIMMSFVFSILILAPWIVTLWRIYVTRTMLLVDRLPLWKHLILYARRDNEIIPVVGERTYPGESFIEGGKGLGLIEYLGKDCWHNWGDKKIVWGLENINYTPDPRYFNFTHLLYSIGFTDSDDVKRVLNGEDLELMGKVYLKMQEYDGGVDRAVKMMKEYDKDVVKFKPVKHKEIGKMVDEKLKRVAK